MTSKTKPTEAEIDAVVAEGNFLFLDGYRFQVGTHFIQWIDEQAAIRKQVALLNAMLALLGDNWSTMPLVTSVDGKAAVLVWQVDDVLRHPKKFPHERFVALMKAFEQEAQKVVNPEGSEDRFLAPDRGGTSLEKLLAVANVPEAAIRHVLADAALTATGSISILVPSDGGEATPLRLPPTEQLRKPSNPPVGEEKSFEAYIVEMVHMFAWLVTDDGRLIEVPRETLGYFKTGNTYAFTEVADPITTSKRLLRARCEGLRQPGLL